MIFRPASRRKSDESFAKNYAQMLRKTSRAAGQRQSAAAGGMSALVEIHGYLLWMGRHALSYSPFQRPANCRGQGARCKGLLQKTKRKSQHAVLDDVIAMGATKVTILYAPALRVFGLVITKPFVNSHYCLRLWSHDFE